MRDLSHPLYDQMPVYPGDPTVSIAPALTVEHDGVAVTALSIGSHTGTHVDAPAHTIVGGRTMRDVALEELVGDAWVINIPAFYGQLSESQAIEPELITQAARAQGLTDNRVPRIVAIAMGWSRHFGETSYERHPFLTRESAAMLWERGMRVLAVDTLSPDQTPSEDFPVHEVVLGGDGLIVENMTGLMALPARVRLGFFPLHLGPADGAPVRAVAFETSDPVAAGDSLRGYRQPYAALRDT